MNGLLLALSLLACDTLAMDTLFVLPPPFMDINTLRVTLVYETDTLLSGSIWEYLDVLQAIEDAGYEVEVVNDSVICKPKENTIGDTDR